MAAVYAAEQRGLSTLTRRVAVKVLPKRNDDRDDHRRRQFILEAQHVMAMGSSRHVVQVYDTGEEDGWAYIAMQFTSAGSLADLLERRALSLSEAINYVSEASEGLAYAHERGVVHGDIKPANLLLDDEGYIRVADFGLSRLVGENLGDGLVSNVSGSPPYMAPEQWRTGKATPMSDLYAVGITLFELVSSRRPFSGDNIGELAYRHCQEPLPRLEPLGVQVPADLAVLLDRLCSKDELLRPKSAKALISELGELAGRMRQRPFPRGSDLVPYRGLRSFESEHARFFFGREALTGSLTVQLETIAAMTGSEPRLIAVIGASGSGKSSLVRAGLIPACTRRSSDSTESLVDGASKVLGPAWLPVVMRPGATPQESLITALETAWNLTAVELLDLTERLSGRRTSGSTNPLTEVVSLRLPERHQRLLVVIDQFEELFTPSASELLRTQFISMILHAASDREGRVDLVLTLRSDFLVETQAYPDLDAAIGRRSFVVTPLSGNTLREAIVGPASVAGYPLSEGVVEALRAAADGRPGAMAPLQHLLMLVWQGLLEHTEERETLARIGGLSGALAATAQDAFSRLEPAQQQRTRGLFLDLVQLGDDGRPTRRRAALRTVLRRGEPRAVLSDVINAFAASDVRLLVTSGDSSGDLLVEVSHEALFEGWDLLKGWIEEERAELPFRRAAEGRSASWLAQGRDDGYLLREPELGRLEALAERHGGDLSDGLHQFLDASREMAARERSRQVAEHALREAKAAADVRYTARLRVGILTIGLLLIAAVASLAFALWSKSRAETQHAANRRQLYESRMHAASQALLRHQIPEVVRLLQMEHPGVSGEQDLRAFEWYALWQLIHPEGPVMRYPPAGLSALVWMVDDRHIAVGSTEGGLGLFDTDSGDLVRHVPAAKMATARGARVSALRRDQNATTVSILQYDGTLSRWDPMLEASEPLRVRPETLSGADLDMSADGRYLALGGEHLNVSVLDWPGLKEAVALPHAGYVEALAFLPGGQLLSGSQTGVLRRWLLPSGELLHERRMNESIMDAEISPRGDRLLVNAELMDPVSFSTIARLPHGRDGNASFSPDGRLLATGGALGIVYLWDATTLAPVAELFGHLDTIEAIQFSPGGSRLATVSSDGTLRVWDTKTPGAWPYLGPLPDAVHSLAFSPDGDRIATGSYDGIARVWNVGRRQLEWATTSEIQAGTSVRFSSDGQNLILGRDRGASTLWDATSGEPIDPKAWLDALPTEVSREGLWMGVGGGTDGVVRVWTPASGKAVQAGLDRGVTTLLDASTGQAIAIDREFEGTGGELSHDGTLMATGSGQGVVRVWNRLNGQVVHEFGDLGFDCQAKFSGNDRWLFTWCVSPGHVSIWNRSDWSLSKRLNVEGDQTRALALSSDGSLIATGGYDKIIRVWRLSEDTGDVILLHELQGQEETVFSLAFSPDGLRLASGARGGGIYLWNVETGGLVALLSLYSDRVHALAFSSDGLTLAAAGEDGYVRFIQAATPEQVAKVAGGR